MGKDNEVKDIFDDIAGIISVKQLSEKYFNRHSSWFYHKLNEDRVNNVQYEFADAELDLLVSSLHDISARINNSAQRLARLCERRKKQKGRFLTCCNPFNHEAFMQWWSEIDFNTFNPVILEPFAGDCNIPKMLNNIGIVYDWSCYDIQPSKQEAYKVVKRNTLAKFPKSYDVCITNPPYLAKSSASRLKLPYPDTVYDDVYKMSLDLMLRHCKYVAAIIPESFITSNLFLDRLDCVISLTQRLFTDTECPVCLALFSPSPKEVHIYRGERYIGTLGDLQQHGISEYANGGNWQFNDPNGEIGVRCVDSKQEADIFFCKGEVIQSDIHNSSRAFTRISGLPTHIRLEDFICCCNAILKQYRVDTNDIFLTSFKGLRADGLYRRRIDFHTIRAIMNKAVESFQKYIQ